MAQFRTSLCGISSSGSAATVPIVSTVVIIRKTNAIIPVNKRQPRTDTTRRFLEGSIIVTNLLFFLSLPTALLGYDGYSICSLLCGEVLSSWRGWFFLWFIYLLVLWVYISHTLSDIRMVPRCTFSFGRLFPWPIMPTRQIVGYHSNDQSLCGWNHFYDGLELFPLFSSFSTLLYINKIFNLNINYTISVAETKSTDIFSPPFASAYENCCSAAYLTPKGWCWYIYSVGDVGVEGGGSPRRALWTPIPAQ